MAQFCYDCSIKVFGKDFQDFKHNKIGQVANVLCEGCGWIWVDWRGRSVNRDNFYEWIKEVILNY